MTHTNTQVIMQMPSLDRLSTSAMLDLEETMVKGCETSIADRWRDMKAAQKEIEHRKLDHLCQEEESSVVVDLVQAGELLKRRKNMAKPGRIDGGESVMDVKIRTGQESWNEQGSSPFPYIPKQKKKMAKIQKVIAELNYE